MEALYWIQTAKNCFLICIGAPVLHSPILSWCPAFMPLLLNCSDVCSSCIDAVWCRGAGIALRSVVSVSDGCRPGWQAHERVHHGSIRLFPCLLASFQTSFPLVVFFCWIAFCMQQILNASSTADSFQGSGMWPTAYPSMAGTMAPSSGPYFGGNPQQIPCQQTTIASTPAPSSRETDSHMSSAMRGHLFSRPRACQARTSGAIKMAATNRDTEEMEEEDDDNHERRGRGRPAGRRNTPTSAEGKVNFTFSPFFTFFMPFQDMSIAQGAPVSRVHMSF